MLPWIIFYCLATAKLEEDESENKPLEESIGVVNIVMDTENITQIADQSDEEWVHTAVLDVAYYLRAHKFSDYDRRYYKDPVVQESFQYLRFPDPPLRYFHWEVYKYCDMGFYDCLAYLHDIVSKADLIRSLDTNVIMNERRWAYPHDEKSIEKVDKECKRLKTIDWRNADPFKGPLERFQWRVSASYYMCHFSMQNLSPLIMFGERCDNFAGCLEGNIPFNGDPRAEDSKPYQCAMYSFCPDACCPLKSIQGIDECLDHVENQCPWQVESSKRRCVFQRENNRQLNAMVLNQWNVTCPCEPGYVWESMYGSCVDVDECSIGTHQCISMLQTCLNLRGHYACVCHWGYINVTSTCVPNDSLNNALAGLHVHHHTSTKISSHPFSIFWFLFDWTIGLLIPHKDISVSSNKSKIRNDVVLNPDDF